jgi:hypothetical protein
LISLYPFLIAGGLGGLVSSLGCGVLWSVVEWWRPQLAERWSGGRSLGLAGVVLHYIGGTLLGLLFWCSWGLTALIDVEWWLRAVFFGVLTFASLSVPAVLTTALSRDVPWPSAISLLTQWACTCLIASLACAWTWNASLRVL